VLHTRVVTGSGGGPEKTILNSPRYLAGNGYRAVCAYMHPPGDPGFDDVRQKAREWQAPLYSVHDRGPWDMRVVGDFLNICRRERVAIWHGHDYKSNALGLLLRPLWPMRLVTTVHGWVKQTARTPLYYGIDRLCLRHYERVICVANDLHARCLACGVPPSRCEFVENAIDEEQYSRRHSVDLAKTRCGFTPGRLLIGAVGRLSAEKGFDCLIHAADRLLKSGLDAELIIVGDGDERPRLQSLVDELGCADRVHVLGYRNDTIELYEAMDVFALSSLREGLPNVVLEAMAIEVPVVATRVAGIPRLIQPEENGLLVEAGDADALAGALSRLLTDANLRLRLGRAGRRTVESHYTFTARMQKICAIYDSLQLSRGT
jgi:glycosyltransferase involved in cell wall biosynthesis